MDPNTIDTIVLVSCMAFAAAVAVTAKWFATHPSIARPPRPVT